MMMIQSTGVMPPKFLQSTGQTTKSGSLHDSFKPVKESANKKNLRNKMLESLLLKLKIARAVNTVALAFSN
jgi:hypothetical protein